jgi:quinol-cytochrome oxidoreductase complex cytochrome b subunit
MESITLLKGIAAGAAATAAMLMVEVPAWKMWGLTGVMEWQENQGIAKRALHKPAETLVAPGLTLHFLHGCLAGIVFAIVISIVTLGLPVPLLGLAYGLLLWILGLAIFKPIIGERIPGGRSGRIAVSVNLAGHMVYGLVLGISMVLS